MTTLAADAADDAAIAGVCKQALQEEGRLDVFFANVTRSAMMHPRGRTDVMVRLASRRINICKTRARRRS